MKVFAQLKQFILIKFTDKRKSNQKSEKSIWNDLKRVAETIGEFAVEVLRYSNDPEPILSNGRAHVLQAGSD
jgi:hypothetical protein